MYFVFLATCKENAEEAFSYHCSTSEKVQSHYVICIKAESFNS